MSINSGDTYNLQKSLESQKDRTPYSKKSIIYANDVNSGSYTNQLVFDLSSFANVVNGFLSLSEATLQIPVVITVSTPSGVAGPAALDYFISLKNGSHNIVNSISVNYDSKEVVQPNNFTNSFVSYKILSSWSSDDLKNFGATCLFAPDSANSWMYNSVDRAPADLATNDSRLLNGNGICNNQNIPNYTFAPTATSTNVGEFDFCNEGCLKRQFMINSKPADAAATTATTIQTQNLTAVRNENNFRNELKNYTRVTNGGQAGFFQQFYVLCNIPLKYLSSFFENIPLVKGAYLKMNITLNTGSFVVNTPNLRTANAPGMYCNSSDIAFQYTNPVMVCERPTANMAGARYLVSVGVVNAPATTASGFISHSSLPGVQPHALTSCRITIPICELKPEDSVNYLESSLSKRVEWQDIYQTQILNVPAGGNFNSMISNGTKDALGVLIIPLISASVNGNLVPTTGAAILANTSFSPSLSPFTTEPATPSPLSLTQLQVLHGGQNVVSPFISYTYEQFLYQLNEVYKINGNQSTGLTSGLISQADWENGCRYYFINLSRELEEESMPKSITVIATNNNNVSMDCLVFVISKKSMTINCATGKVLS